MNNILLFGLYEQIQLAQSIAKHLQLPVGELVIHQFPDLETLIKTHDDVVDKEIIIVCSLNQPNLKILPLLFAASTLKSLGAKRVGLCAPYLAYMRQDIQFHKGEGVTSRYFASLISSHFDFLLTVDPHLHRYHDLNEIYSIPSKTLHAASPIAQWVTQHIDKPIFIGPDSESEQWVKEIAQRAGDGPYTILEKVRHGDNQVEISVPQLEHYKQYTPVLVDDIVSSAHTMQETINHIHQQNMPPAVCITVHPIFAGDAYQRLQQSGAMQVISCNSLAHPSNQIDLSSLIANGIREMISHA